MSLAAGLRECLNFLDCIKLEGISAIGHHGVYPEEKLGGQEFRVDAEIYLNTRKAGLSDNLQETVDYAQAAKLIEHILTGPHYDLLESLAQQIADTLLALPGVQVVQICLHKPEAPLPLETEDVCLRIWRGLDRLNDQFLASQHQIKLANNSNLLATNDTDDNKKLFREEASISVAEDDLNFLGPLSASSPRLRQARENFALEKQEKAAYERSLLPASLQRPKMEVTDQSQLDPIFDRRPNRPRKALIALGGNLGEVAQTLRSAVAQLRAIPGVGVTKISSLYQTPALLRPGQSAQPDYLNAAALIRTVLSPRELWEQMARIEQIYGRERNERWAARTIDLDLIYYSGVIGKDVQLTLPHPEALNRAFVLIPWAELEPELVSQDPQKIEKLAGFVSDPTAIKSIRNHWIDPVTANQFDTPLPEWNDLTHHLQTRRVLDEVLAAAGNTENEVAEIVFEQTELPVILDGWEGSGFSEVALAEESSEMNEPIVEPAETDLEAASEEIPIYFDQSQAVQVNDESIELPIYFTEPETKFDSENFPTVAVEVEPELELEVDSDPVSVSEIGVDHDSGPITDEVTAASSLITPTSTDLVDESNTGVDAEKTKDTWQRIKAFFGFNGNLDAKTGGVKTNQVDVETENNLPEVPWEEKNFSSNDLDDCNQVNYEDPDTCKIETLNDNSNVGKTQISWKRLDEYKESFPTDLPLPKPPTFSATTNESEGRHSGELVTGDIPAMIGLSDETSIPEPADLDIEELAAIGEAAVPDGKKRIAEKQSGQRRPILRPTTTGSIPVIKAPITETGSEKQGE